MDYAGKTVALAVTANKDVTEQQVRRMIDSEASRSPEFREAAKAIDCVRIAFANVDPSNYSRELANMYVMSMQAQGWASVSNLHVFEYLEEPPVYIGFPI